MSFNFKRGDMVRLVGTGAILRVSNQWEEDDNVLLSSPYGQLISVDYRGVEALPQIDFNILFAANQKLFMHLLISFLNPLKTMIVWDWKTTRFNSQKCALSGIETTSFQQCREKAASEFEHRAYSWIDCSLNDENLAIASFASMQVLSYSAYVQMLYWAQENRKNNVQIERAFDAHFKVLKQTTGPVSQRFAQGE